MSEIKLPKLQKVDPNKPKKKKILLLADDLRMHSGIATQSKEFVMGTLDKYDWVQLGGAIKHPEEGKVIDMSQAVKNDYRTNHVMEFSKAALPKYFPERFLENSKPFRFHVGMNDYPALECANPYTGVRCTDMPKGTTFYTGTIPIKYKTSLPQLRPFPNVDLLDCFTNFISNGPVCNWFTVTPESACDPSEDDWEAVHHAGAEGLMLWDKDFSSLKKIFRQKVTLKSFP